MRKQVLVTMLLAVLLVAVSLMNADVITIGSGTATTANLPITTYYGYSYSQQLYTPAQITMGGTINKLSFYWASGGNTNSSAWVVYMGHTTKTAFASTTDWVPVSSMTQVFNGSVTIPSSAGWMEITLSTPFEYNNSDNLVIAVDENTASYAASNGNWYSFTSATNGAIYYRSDSTNPNPSSPPTANGRLSVANQIRLDITAAAGIANPASATAVAASYSQIDLNWTKNANNNDVMIAYNTTNSFGTPVNGTSYPVGNTLPGGEGTIIYDGSGTSYNHTGLNSNTTYYYKFFSKDGSTAYSNGLGKSVTTPLAPITSFPWTETFEADSSTRAGWTQTYEAGAGDWTYAAGSSGVLTTAYAGALNARYVGVSGANTPITKLISPTLDLSNKATSYILKFWYAQPNWSGDQNETKVYYRTSPSSGWVQLAHYTADASVWTEEPGIVLPSPSATYQIAIEGINNYGYANAIDNVTVEAAALDPLFAVSPASKDFGNQQIGANSAAQVFTIKNNGGGVLTINSVSLLGVDSAEFNLTDVNSYPVELDGGETITVSVIFSPTTLGAKSAYLSIVDDLNLEPNQVALSGTGTDSTIRELPYIQTWDVAALVDGWISYNVNSDAYTWGLALDGSSQVAFIRYNSTAAMNDWLVSPPIVLQAGTTYQVTYRYRCASATYPENMKLAFGNMQDPTAMTEVIADHQSFINTAYANGSATFTPSTSGNWYLGVHGYSAADMYNIYLEDVRILLPNTNIGQVVATGATANVTVPEILVGATPVTPQVAFSGLSGNPVIHVAASYGTTGDELTSERLVLTIDGGNLAGVTVTMTHNLGFTPQVLAYRIGSGNAMLINNPGDWTETTAYFTVPAGKGPLSLKIVFPKDRDDTLPVELSSFTAVLTADMFVHVAWVAASETNHLGYNILRNNTADLENAVTINNGLITEGNQTGSQVSYDYIDGEVLHGESYYYWLQSLDLSGVAQFYGPLLVTVTGNPEDPGTPVIPTVTQLLNAYPNPFNPSTSIRYTMAEAGKSRIDIYNLRGQLLRSFENDHAVAGVYQVNWDGMDSNGNSVGSGIYLYRMSSGSYSSTKKMILSK